MAVKNRLKEIRHDRRMNQIQFAEFLGVAQYQYNRYELQRQQRTYDMALRIAENLNMPVEQIFYLDKQ